jgi:hypothetical protein
MAGDAQIDASSFQKANTALWTYFTMVAVEGWFFKLLCVWGRPAAAGDADLK